MKLNRTGSNWNRLERNKINENWDIIEGSYNDVVGQITDEVVGHLIDSAKLIWKEPVDTVEDLPANAEVGETRMVREADPDGISYVYRYDGENWEKIQAIDVTLVNEVDRRLTRQLVDTDQQRFYDSMIIRRIPGMYASYVDDDGRQGVYTKIFPVFSDYGIPFTSALITSRLDDATAITSAQRKEMHESGLVEFMSHTHWHDPNHRPNDMSDEELNFDFSTSQKIIKSLGYNHRGLVLPFGDRSDKVLKTAKKYYDYVIGTGSGGPGGPGRVNYIGELDNQYLWRISLEYGFDYVKEKVDELVDRGYGWIIFIGHVDAGNWYTESYMRQVIDYVNSKGIGWVKTQDGINNIGNIAQFGNTKIGADGTINSEELGTVIVQNAPETNGMTPISEFKKGAITVSRIRFQQLDGLPQDANSGILTTYRFTDDIWSCQKYETTRMKKKYERYWDADNHSWTEWVSVDISQYLGVNAVGIDEPPTNYRLIKKITSTIINNVANEPFPESKSGILTTYALTVDAFAYQEYKIYQSNRVYRRNWTGSSWGDWYLIQDIVSAHGLGSDVITSSTPANSFGEGISIAYISRAAADKGLPSTGTQFDNSGVLTTYKQTSNKGRTYQEFKEYDSFNKYIRYETPEGDWSAWKKFVMEEV